MAPTRITFLTLIARNRRNSVFLMLVMGALVVLLGAIFSSAWLDDILPGIFIAGLLAAVMVGVSFYEGNNIILAMSGARRIEKRDHPQLFNVVEELAIAGGIPMPSVYLIEDTAPNAFATGRDPQNAAVAVTRGLIEKLDRDELQGVMAHEIAHIRNFDIRFAMLMAVLVGVVVLLSDFFLRGTFWGGGGRRRSSSKGGGNAIIFLVAIALAILAPLFAQLIQLAMSRQREYLADASAVQLTRYPDGLARALQKIAMDDEPLEAANRATQHLYIVNPLNKYKWGADSIFSTHPPIEKRVELLRRLSVTGAK